MARRRRGATRSARKTGALIWTTLLNDEVEMAPFATKVASNIVQDSDWTAVGGQERATIMRVRGWFSVAMQPVGALTASVGVFGYIGVYDEDEPSLGADIAGTYADEDIMTTFGHVFPYSNISQTSLDTWNQEVDVKAMRKIRRGQQLRFVLTNVGPTPLDVSLILRALVKRS